MRLVPILITAGVLCSSLLSVTSVTSVASVSAADWPYQRGPALTGVVPVDAKVTTVLPESPKVLKGPVEDEFAAAIISYGRVIYGDLQNGKESYHALALKDAKLLWSDVLDAAHKDGFGTGPRCAPVSDGKVVVTQSCKGELHCLDAASGNFLWNSNYLTDFAAPYMGEKGKIEDGARHGYSASPCIDGDQVIALAGGPGAGVLCFDKMSGKVMWKSQDDQAAYSPPMVVTLAGVVQVVACTVSGVIGLQRTDGKLLWRVPLTTSDGRHFIAPVMYDDVVIVATHEVGLVATRVVKKGASVGAEEAWKVGKEWGRIFLARSALAIICICR